LIGDVGDEQRREEELLALELRRQRFEQRIALLREMREGEFFDLRDDEAVAVSWVGFAVRADRLLRRHR
jgi:hypothetical protein